MPLYEYLCRSCGKRFEAFVLGSAQPDCPACNGADLQRLLSTFAVASSGARERADSPAACGACGDPRGPGACGTADS